MWPILPPMPLLPSLTLYTSEEITCTEETYHYGKMSK